MATEFASVGTASQLFSAHFLAREFLLATDALLLLGAAETLLQCSGATRRAWPCMALHCTIVQAACKGEPANVTTRPMPRVAALCRCSFLAAAVAASWRANCCALGARAWMAQLGTRVRATSISFANLAATVRSEMWAGLRLQHLLTETSVLRQGTDLMIAAPRARPSKLRPVAVAGAPHPEVGAL